MIKYPDYKNSILGIPNSILHSMGLEPERGTLMLLDRYLEGKDYENIVVILLDGMGKNIMDANLARRGFFQSHLAGTLSSTHFRLRLWLPRHRYRVVWSHVSMGGSAGTATIRRLTRT